MKQSTNVAPKPPQHKSILLIGPPGGGKTTLLMQFPKVCIIDCDENLDGPESYLRYGRKDPKGVVIEAPKLPTLDYWYDCVWDNGKGGRTLVEQCYDMVMLKIEEAKKSDCITVGLDSLTHINEFIIRKINSAQHRDEMELRDWIPFKSHFLNLLVSKVRGLGKHVVCTVHETIVTEPDPKNPTNRLDKRYEPSVQGSVCDFFGAFFTDVWRCHAMLGPGNKVDYYLTTGRTTKSDLKNSCGMPHEMKNPTFEEINKYLKI